MQDLRPAWSPEKFLPALIVVVIISLLSIWGMNALGGAERVRGLVEGAGWLGPVVFILLKASTYVLAPLSGTPFKIAAGALFGVWDGLLYTTLGDTLGGSLNFWIARWLGRPGIRRFAGSKALVKVDETLDQAGGWRGLLIARVVLASLYDFISYAAGLSKLPFKHYLWVTVVGGIPAGIMFVVIGDQLTTGSGATFLLLGALVVMALLLTLQRFTNRRG